MGWSTELFTNISFNRKTYNTRYDVERDLEESKDMLNSMIQRLKQMVTITDPKKFIDEETDPLWWLNNETDEILNEIQDLTIEIWKLEKLLDEWNACHTPDGEPIDLPEGVNYMSSFIWGDFVEGPSKKKTKEILGQVGKSKEEAKPAENE